MTTLTIPAREILPGDVLTIAGLPFTAAGLSSLGRTQRIQRQRIKGWRMPEGAVYVGRPTKWGNPFQLGHKQYGLVRFGPKHVERFGRAWDFEGRCSAAGASHHMWFSRDDIVETYVRMGTRSEMVELFRLAILDPTPGMMLASPSRKGHMVHVSVDEIRRELAGKDLACWCPLNMPCHADILLGLANRPEVLT